MGAFTTEMEALVHGIRASAKERAGAIAGVRKNTARILSDARGLIGRIGKGRRDMGRRLERHLRTAAGALRKSVEALLRDFDVAQKRANVLGSLAADRKNRSSFVEGLMNDVGRARADRSDHLAQSLRDFMDRIHGEVTCLLSAAQASQRAGSAATQQRVSEALSTIRARVATIAENARDFVQRSEAARGRMGHEVREALSADRDARLDQLGALLRTFDDTQRSIAEDLRAAGELWHGLGLSPATQAQARPRPKPRRPGKTTAAAPRRHKGGPRN